MALIDQQEIDRAKYDIVGVINRYITLKKGGKNYSSCCPFHKEKSPSFTVNEDKGFFYCLAAETEVMTWDGIKPIKDLAGASHKILTHGGKWVEAPFMAFGIQRLMEITLSRNGVSKKIRATPEHRWFAKRVAGDITTDNLTPGQYLESCTPIKADFSLSAQGIRHGIVFGDGTVRHGYGLVDLHQEKMELSRFFEGVFSVKTLRSGHEYKKVYGGKPFGHMKQKPSLLADNDYLAGFLAGYIATDGCVDDRGAVTISSSRLEDLELVEVICSRLGIGTGSIGMFMRKGYLDEPGPMYQLGFHGHTFCDSLLLRSKHQQRFASKSKRFPARARWKVLSVEDLGIAEEVFCAYVEGTHSFALAGNILTGNCFGCGASGNAIDFVMEHDGLSFPAAVEAINGSLSPSITPEMVRKRATQDRTTKPSDHKENPEQAKILLAKCEHVETHMHLLRNNTAPHDTVKTLKGSLIVDLYNQAGELVNLAAIQADGSIKYSAGGISYGAVATIEPVGKHDGSVILTMDYAEAWRLWWSRKGNSKVLCCMEFSACKWMADKQRERFTHIGCSQEFAEEFEDYGHDVILIQPAYSVKVA